MRLRKEEECVVLAVVARKGGVGKTFVALNTAINAAMGGPHKSEKPLKVLFIDVDSQQNSSYFFLKSTGASVLGQRVLLPPNADCDQNNIYTIADVFAGNEFMEYATDYSNIHIIPSDGNIDDLRSISPNADAVNDDSLTKVSVMQFQGLIELVKDDYDLIVIDTPPSKTHASQGAIAAATHCLVVTTPDSYNAEIAVPGIVADIKNNNERFRQSYNHAEISGIIFNKISSTNPTKHEQQHFENIKSAFPELTNNRPYFCNYVAFNTEIPQSPNNFDWMKHNKAKGQMEKFYEFVRTKVVNKIYEEANKND